MRTIFKAKIAVALLGLCYGSLLVTFFIGLRAGVVPLLLMGLEALLLVMGAGYLCYLVRSSRNAKEVIR
ncbi:MAG: hypothetical protein OEZ48_00130 [Candidatus Bathyarchaeota archaeon]|nr:hypothetical protein [Candidatus Bathyarchaeota archaeon]MDH5686263.1 hypothetical protein [Candidatus Bathyarchaeota archaeon]